jgi:outer membrane protein OmpA-like peptidoglycan-associated protein
VLVFFDWNSGKLSAQSLEQLRPLPGGNVPLDWTPERSELRLKVQGHADSSGPAAYNMNLSRRRAEAVAAVWETWGTRRDRMQVEWFGESRRLALTPDGEREARTAGSIACSSNCSGALPVVP